MTEPFLVPESPYDGAHLRNLFRQEVERFARELPMMLTRTQREWITAYLAARFPEAARTTKCEVPDCVLPSGHREAHGHNLCGHHLLENCAVCAPTPSAPAEICGAAFEHTLCNLPSRHRGNHSWQNRPLPLPERDERTCPTCGALLLYSERIGVASANAPSHDSDRCTACPCVLCHAEREFVRALARRELRVSPLLDKLLSLLGGADAEALTSPNCTLDAARRVVAP